MDTRISLLRRVYRGVCGGAAVAATGVMLAFSAPTAVCAQAPLVHEMFSQGMLNPHGFDALVANSKPRFDQTFYRCLRVMRQKLAAMEASSDQICGSHVDPNWRMQCLRDNPARGVASALSDIETVTRGQATWSETRSGNGAFKTDNILGALIEDFDRTTYQQLLFVFGKQIADAKRQELIDSMTAPVLQYFELMRSVMTCP